MAPNIGTAALGINGIFRVRIVQSAWSLESECGARCTAGPNLDPLVGFVERIDAPLS